MSLIRPLFLLLLVLPGALVCVGQEPGPKSKNRDFWKLQANLITDQILQESKFVNPLDRAVLWGRLAAIWWKFDRERAPKWLNEAIDVVDSSPKEESASDRRRRLSSLRVLLSIAAPLDRRSSNRLAGLLSRNELNVNDETSQNADALVQAALNVVQSDPARAAELGSACLRAGKCLSFSNLLVRLRAQNKNLGDALFAEALSRASATTDLDLLTSLTIMAFNTLPASSELRKHIVVVVSRQFSGDDQHITRSCLLTPVLVPLLEQFAIAEPQAASIVRNALIQCRRVQSSRSEDADNVWPDFPLKTVDSLLEAANKTANIEKKVVYLGRAAYLAAGEKNFIRALSILDAFNEEEREQLGSVWGNWRWEFASSAAIACLKQTDRYGMDKIIATTPVRLRAFVQLVVADEVSNAGDPAGAIELLEASRKAFKLDTRDLFDWYLSLVRRYAKLAPNEGVAVFREFVTNTNQFRQSETTTDATGYDSYAPVELPAALVEPDLVGILQATSQIKPFEIRMRIQLGFLKTFLELGRKVNSKRRSASQFGS